MYQRVVYGFNEATHKIYTKGNWTDKNIFILCSCSFFFKCSKWRSLTEVRRLKSFLLLHQLNSFPNIYFSLIQTICFSEWMLLSYIVSFGLFFEGKIRKFISWWDELRMFWGLNRLLLLLKRSDHFVKLFFFISFAYSKKRVIRQNINLINFNYWVTGAISLKFQV